MLEKSPKTPGLERGREKSVETHRVSPEPPRSRIPTGDGRAVRERRRSYKIGHSLWLGDGLREGLVSRDHNGDRR